MGLCRRLMRRNKKKTDEIPCKRLRIWTTLTLGQSATFGRKPVPWKHHPLLWSMVVGASWCRDWVLGTCSGWIARYVEPNMQSWRNEWQNKGEVVEREKPKINLDENKKREEKVIRDKGWMRGGPYKVHLWLVVRHSMNVL